MGVPTRLTSLQQDVLAAVGELEPASPGDIAATLRRPVSSIRGTLKRLEAHGLAECRKTERRWRLTDIGRGLNDHIWEGA